jgi:multiple sugar transport system ATP-binding protein
VIGIRPEQLEDAALVRDVPDDSRVRGEVELREALGSELMVHFRLDVPPAITEEVKELAADAGTTAEELGGGGSRSTVMVGRFSPDSKVREGEAAEVAVDTRALHFFDTETGTAIYDSQGTKGATA